MIRQNVHGLETEGTFVTATKALISKVLRGLQNDGDGLSKASALFSETEEESGCLCSRRGLRGISKVGLCVTEV